MSARSPAAGWLAAALVALLAGPLLASTGAQGAQAFGVTPPQVSVLQAQSGETYVRAVRLQNQLDSASTITIERDGLVGSWASTDPPTGFQVSARAEQNVLIHIAVPDGAQGLHTGQLRFVTENKGNPGGSGAGIRYAVSVRLNVTIEGGPDAQVAWQEVRVPNVEAGTHPTALVNLTNTGNVAVMARFQGQVRPLDGEEVIVNATGSGSVAPGAHATIAVHAEAALPIGQYVFRVRAVDPVGLDETRPFTVFEPGRVVPTAALQAIRHAPRVQVGQTVELNAIVENLGNTPIGQATFIAEIRRGDEVLASLVGSSTEVDVGARANSTASWSADRTGIVTITGRVQYDGFRTMDRESVLTVTPAPPYQSGWFVLLLVPGLIVIAVVLRMRRGRREG